MNGLYAPNYLPHITMTKMQNEKNAKKTRNGNKQLHIKRQNEMDFTSKNRDNVSQNKFR